MGDLGSLLDPAPERVETAGLHELCITVVYFLVSLCCLVPVLHGRLQKIRQGGSNLQATAALSALANTFCSIVIVHIDVVGAMLLICLTPIGSTILARAVLGEVFRCRAMQAIGLDWVPDLSGQSPRFVSIGTAAFLRSRYWRVLPVGSDLLDRDRACRGTGQRTGCGFGADHASLSCAGDRDHVHSRHVHLAPGPNYMNPGLAGLLFMSEIVLGAVSATLLSGESLGWREFTGVLLIAGASLVETLLAILPVRRKVVMTVERGEANSDASCD